MKSRLGRLLRDWIAAALAHREHQIEISVRRDPANRELKGCPQLSRPYRALSFPNERNRPSCAPWVADGLMIVVSVQAPGRAGD
jgi:hypothetical protein